MSVRKFPDDYSNIGGRPRVPVTLSKHAVKQFALRYGPRDYALAQTELEALVARAMWGGKTTQGSPVLIADGVPMVVRRWEMKYQVVTVLPRSAMLLKECKRGPGNPPHYARVGDSADYREVRKP